MGLGQARRRTVPHGLPLAPPACLGHCPRAAGLAVRVPWHPFRPLPELRVGVGHLRPLPGPNLGVAGGWGLGGVPQSGLQGPACVVASASWETSLWSLKCGSPPVATACT